MPHILYHFLAQSLISPRDGLWELTWLLSPFICGFMGLIKIFPFPHHPNSKQFDKYPKSQPNGRIMSLLLLIMLSGECAFWSLANRIGAIVA